MKINKIIEASPFELLTPHLDLDKEVSGVYIGDLLSWVMGRGKAGSLWLTVLTHQNIIGVAALREFAAVIICEDAAVNEELIALAKEEEIIILHSKLPLYETSVILNNLLK